MNLIDLPTPVRLCVTFFLLCIAMGVVQAQLYLNLTVKSDPNSLFPSYQDIQDHFYVKKVPILRRAIDTNMSKYVETEEDREAFYQFMKDKAPQDQYEKVLQPILEFSCVDCHSQGGEASFADYTNYEGIRAKAIFSYWPYIRRRLRISHPHMLAIPLFILPLALGLWFTPLSARVKGILMSLPFVGVLVDISSWFLTMAVPTGSALIVLGGGITAGSVVMILLAELYFLWFVRRKSS
ncbi:hypothetical protein HOF92_04700 [bacterium]|nr:hypothetical protein [bacterium]